MPGARGLVRADEVLTTFFGDQRRAAGPRRLDRLATAEAALRDCLDAYAPGMLGTQETTLLALERQFERSSAVARVAGADLVLLLLPLYLDEPRWHGDDLIDRQLRIRLAEPLAEHIVHAAPGASLGRPAWIVGAAVRHEIWLLRQEREALRRR